MIVKSAFLFLIAFQQPDSLTYSTPALRDMVQDAAEMNRRVPEVLGGYRAMLESEISIGNRRTEGMESAVSLEQVASVLTWDRTGEYEQMIIGYRTQAVGAAFATIGFFRNGWAIPSLYGNRLALLFGRDTSTQSNRRRSSNATLYAVHPLADDREDYYRFSGGDTIVTMGTGDREIPIVRVSVRLRPDVPQRSVVFVGDLDLDASRNHLVRIRGYFAVVGGGRRSPLGFLSQAGLQSVVYIEAENVEVDGSVWLPSWQRFEAQATSSTVGDARAVFRILTRFRERELLPPPPSVVVGAENDTLAIRPFRLGLGSRDSVGGFDDWRLNLGEATANVSAEDFNDVAPGSWRADGPPTFSFGTERLGDVIRFDRVQGVFTGGGAVMRFRDAAPGLTVRAAAGYAWTERTVRGRGVVEYRRNNTQLALRTQRSLDITNDFRSPYDSGSTLGALLGSDNYDYIDRRSTTLQFLHYFGEQSRGQLRIETGIVDERSVPMHMRRSPLGLGEPFRPNRIVSDGHYIRQGIQLDWRPDVSLEYLRTGLGFRLMYDEGFGGTLNHRRIEGRFTARTNRGPFALGARLDVGMLNPDAPPQQFFELGQNQNLQGYDYKEFAGDQAAVLRGLALWRLPYLGTPIQITQRLWLPPVAPAVAVGLQTGWTRASTPEALATVTALGSRPTERVRASASMSLRFFGGAVGVGVARPIDYPGEWRWLLEFGQRP